MDRKRLNRQQKMWQRRKPVAKRDIPRAVALMQALQAELEDQTNARCLAARTGDQYEEGIICGELAGERRHSISKRYLRPLANSRRPLWVLPCDAVHVAKQTTADGRIAGKGLHEITRIPPKPIAVNQASTWHFACQHHDGMFGPVDKGIKFPRLRQYVSVQTKDATGENKVLEESLFLLAYMIVLSSLSTLRGGSNALGELWLRPRNAPERRVIADQQRANARKVDFIKDFKLHLDRRFARAGKCYMTHHLVPVDPHTGIAIGGLENDRKIVTVLPDDGGSWMVISYLDDDATAVQGSVDNLVNEWPAKLADRDNKQPFIDGVTSSFNSFMSAKDYSTWTKEEQDELESTSARVFLSLVF